ncbi:MAG: 2-amino-4-hydroxy-6-hydroxymethyldihydropteridine diphosphokinase [Anaerolineales bacterium]|nr:2-amino-4-hydroxy-6-hydroxymethyldihydropteridine diphosphokinase [Anaerolineales bacterium]
MIFLSLGTNLGDREANLRSAIAALAPAVRVTRASSVYETAPWGFTDQPSFLNMVVAGETDLPPLELLTFLKTLETKLGRTPTFRYGPRLIDVDILFYDDLTLQTPELVIPHPKLHERAFVLVPLADVAAEWVHPVLGQTVSALLVDTDTAGVFAFEHNESPPHPSTALDKSNSKF